MKTHVFTIKGKLPSLNEYLQAERAFNKKTKNVSGNNMKRECQCLIISEIRAQLRSLKIDAPVHICYDFFEPNKKRDLDNISAVAHKFVQDALVKAGTIKNDGWECVSGFNDNFYVDKKNPRIEITLIEKR